MKTYVHTKMYTQLFLTFIAERKKFTINQILCIFSYSLMQNNLFKCFFFFFCILQWTKRWYYFFGKFLSTGTIQFNFLKMCLLMDCVLFALLLLFLTYRCQLQRFGAPVASGSNHLWQIKSHSCPHQQTVYVSSGSLSCLLRKENDVSLR